MKKNTTYVVKLKEGYFNIMKKKPVEKEKATFFKSEEHDLMDLIFIENAVGGKLEKIK